MSDTVNTQPQADFINVLSSEMISNIVEDYFNRELYKVPVKVVDTKPTESGYAFGICFAPPLDVKTLQFTQEFIERKGIEASYQDVNILPDVKTNNKQRKMSTTK